MVAILSRARVSRFFPDSRRIRYIRPCSFASDRSLKFGNLIIGPAGALHRDGTKRIRRPLAWHVARTRSVSRHECAAGSPRTGRATRAASDRFMGRALEASPGSGNLLGIHGRIRRLHVDRRVGHLWQACLCVALAHFGSSIVWVFSTTLLQMQSDDKFRGRVFAADLGLCMFTIAAGAYLAGRFVDWGFAARNVASVAGMLMLIPAVWWGCRFTRARTQGGTMNT